MVEAVANVRAIQARGLHRVLEAVQRRRRNVPHRLKPRAAPRSVEVMPELRTDPRTRVIRTLQRQVNVRNRPARTVMLRRQDELPGIAPNPIFHRNFPKAGPNVIQSSTKRVDAARCRVVIGEGHYTDQVQVMLQVEPLTERVELLRFREGTGRRREYVSPSTLRPRVNPRKISRGHFTYTDSTARNPHTIM